MKQFIYTIDKKTVFRETQEFRTQISFLVNPLNDELNSICHLLALFGAHRIFHVSWVRVKVVRPGKTSNYCFKYKLSAVWMVQTALVSLYLCCMKCHEMEMCEGLKI